MIFNAVYLIVHSASTEELWHQWAHSLIKRFHVSGNEVYLTTSLRIAFQRYGPVYSLYVNATSWATDILGLEEDLRVYEVVYTD